MINVIDIVVGALILIYLVKNFGGILKTTKSLLIIICALILFGLVTSFISEWSILGEGRQFLKESFIVNLSYNIIKLVYPAIENSAPKVDSYIKDKIIDKTVPTVTIPKVPAIEKMMPKVAVPNLLEVQGPDKKK
ncbi:MAG: hypothetical protein QME05_02140 [Candidatus Margulisbacteria bacterium]|nr:hypothetical protein [Candidatus Margulisiibacteriota bacterium]